MHFYDPNSKIQYLSHHKAITYKDFTLEFKSSSGWCFFQLMLIAFKILNIVIITILLVVALQCKFRLKSPLSRHKPPTLNYDTITKVSSVYFLVHLSPKELNHTLLNFILEDLNLASISSIINLSMLDIRCIWINIFYKCSLENNKLK